MTEFETKLKLASSLVSRGKLSRRDFMQLAIAAGLTMTTANTLFSRAARAEPKKGGTLRIGLGHGSTTDSLDPGTWANSFTFGLGKSLTGAPLVQINQKTEAVPHLAESFEPADGAKKWIFKMRKGTTFHNGKAVTSDDVVATFMFHLGAESKSAMKSPLEAAIAAVKADGPETVIFELKNANADFPFLTSDYHLPIFPSKDGKIEWDKGVGAGPYMLKSFEPGLKLVAERNPNYFKDTWFDAVEQTSIIDATARTNAMIAGEIDYMDRVDLKTIELLKQNPDVNIENVDGFAHYTAPIHCNVAPFDNVDVRSALKWAIDRKELVEKILSGYGSPGNDNPIAKKMKFAVNPEPAYGFDPDKAKFHLKKAGLETLKVDFSTSEAAFAGATDAAQLMQQSAAKCGIEINVIREPDDGYWDNVWLKKPWSMCYWGGRPVCDVMFSTAYAADAAWNDTKWKNPRFNELLIAARAETDDAKRATMYAECQQLVHDDGGQIVLMFNNYVGASSKKLAHGETNSDFDLDGGYLFERWWFA